MYIEHYSPKQVDMITRNQALDSPFIYSGLKINDNFSEVSEITSV